VHVCMRACACGQASAISTVIESDQYWSDKMMFHLNASIIV
jgi:hypothetical protein